ncbi:MAG: hypothetical protein ACTSRS_15220 [Candidatus Helarchaeota archaeon]
MLQEVIFKGEVPLNRLELEIIDKKSEAFENALTSLVPIKMLIYPYVKDFRRKLINQKNLLLTTAKKIIQQPELKEKLVKRTEKKYFLESPFHALVMLYIPRIIIPLHIQKILKRFERRTRRYFRQRLRDFIAFLKMVQTSDLSPSAHDKDYWRFAFPDDKQFTGYLRAQYEYDRKILRMLKRGANWRNFYTLDILNSFSISFIPLYRLFSRIWKRISDTMEEYMKNKVLEFYLVDNLSNHVYNILKKKSYRFLIEETFPVDPEEFKKTIHEPWFIMQTNPQKGLKVERIHPTGEGVHPDGERYTATLMLLFMKMVITWDVYYRFDGPIEEWWIVNSNYTKSMTGYCIYERTPEGYCHYYSITVKVEPSEKLAALGELIIPALEKMTKENTQIMMQNIKKYYQNR